MTNTGVLASSNGDIVFDTVTGNVIEVREVDTSVSALSDIVRVDVEEWLRQYPDEVALLPNTHDILDFGLWRKDGSYDPPSPMWRAEWARPAQRAKSDMYPAPEIKAPILDPCLTAMQDRAARRGWDDCIEAIKEYPGIRIDDDFFKWMAEHQKEFL